MGIDDTLGNKAEEFGGKAKEKIGGATGDRDLQAQGQRDQASSAIKQAVEKVKNVFKR